LCMATFWLLGVRFSSVFYILISGGLGLAIWAIKDRRAQRMDDEEVEK